MPDVEPKPDPADVPMKPAPDPERVAGEADLAGDDAGEPPAKDLTLPTE